MTIGAAHYNGANPSYTDTGCAFCKSCLECIFKECIEDLPFSKKWAMLTAHPELQDKLAQVKSQILELHKKDMRPRHIARKVGLTSEQVSYHIKKLKDQGLI